MWCSYYIQDFLSAGSGNKKKVNTLSSILVGLRILPFTDWIPSVADYILVISQERIKTPFFESVYVKSYNSKKRGRKIKSFVNKSLQTRQYRYAAGSCQQLTTVNFQLWNKHLRRKLWPCWIAAASYQQNWNRKPLWATESSLSPLQCCCSMSYKLNDAENRSRTTGTDLWLPPDFTRYLS